MSDNVENDKYEYTSSNNQNNIISIYGKVIKNKIESLANAVKNFSVIVDETGYSGERERNNFYLK